MKPNHALLLQLLAVADRESLWGAQIMMRQRETVLDAQDATGIRPGTQVIIGDWGADNFKGCRGTVEDVHQFGIVGATDDVAASVKLTVGSSKRIGSHRPQHTIRNVPLRVLVKVER